MFMPQPLQAARSDSYNDVECRFFLLLLHHDPNDVRCVIVCPRLHYWRFAAILQGRDTRLLTHRLESNIQQICRVSV